MIKSRDPWALEKLHNGEAQVFFTTQNVEYAIPTPRSEHNRAVYFTYTLGGNVNNTEAVRSAIILSEEAR